MLPDNPEAGRQYQTAPATVNGQRAESTGRINGQNQRATVEASSWTVEASSGTVEGRPGTVEASSGTVELQRTRRNP